MIVSGVSPATALRSAAAIRREADRLFYLDGRERTDMLELAAALDRCADRNVTRARELAAKRMSRWRAAQKEQRAA